MASARRGDAAALEVLAADEAGGSLWWRFRRVHPWQHEIVRECLRKPARLLIKCEGPPFFDHAGWPPLHSGTEPHATWAPSRAPSTLGYVVAAAEGRR